jgi:hypothetical protein
MVMTALLARPIVIPDESPNGVLLRAAFRNGWESPRFLMLAFKHQYRRGHLTSPVALQRVFDDMGIAEDAAAVTFSADRDFFLGAAKSPPYHLLRTEAAPVCAACLRTRDYLRRKWSNRLICSCADHMVSLVFDCPNCRAICSCGFDLREAKANDASPFARSVDGAFERRDSDIVLALQDTFTCVEAADFTQCSRDFLWANLAGALVFNDRRSVYMLADLLDRNKAMEPYLRTLAGLLKGHHHFIRTRAHQAIQLFLKRKKMRIAAERQQDARCLGPSQQVLRT